jgi:DNA-binding phage protein
MIARKQALLRIEDVVCVLQDEVRKAGGQAELARKTGVNRPNLNSTITGKRPPTNDILRALNLRKVFAYEKEAKTRGQEPLRIEGIVRIIRDEVERAGSRAQWARKNGVHGPSLSGTITGKAPPTKDILRALNLRKMFAYERM